MGLVRFVVVWQLFETGRKSSIETTWEAKTRKRERERER